MTDEKPVIYKYRLPDETIVDIHHDAVKGEAEIDFTLEGGDIVKAVRVPELEEGYNAPEPVDPVNPIEAAAALQTEQAALEPGAVIEYKPIDHLPDHLVRLRNAAAAAEREYDSAAEEAKDAKKAWEKARETFEAAFDAEIRRQADGKTPGLPFDGVHMSDTPQPPQPAAEATEERGPAEVRQFPRAVPPASSEPEPPCNQCGHDAAEHDAPAEDGGARGGCRHTEKNETEDDEPCTCGLYELPPAAAAEPEPQTPSDPTVH